MLTPSVTKLLEWLTSSEPRRRERAAAEVTDIQQYKDAENVRALVSGLCAALLKETDENCKEAELNALGDLKASHNLGVERFLSIAALRPSLDALLLEYFDELFEEEDGPRR